MIRYLLFATDLTVVVLTCLTAIHALRISGLPARFVSFLILLYSVLVLPTPVLSHLNLLGSQTAHLLAHFTMLVSIVVCSRNFTHLAIPCLSLRHFSKVISHCRVLVRYHPSLTLLLISVFCSATINLFVLTFVKQNTVDSLSYHLPRIMYWLQQGNTKPFFTYQIQQTSAPMASSLAMLWTVLHSGGDRLVGFVQLFSVLGSACIVYELARMCGSTRHGSIFSACIWLSFPIVILQAPTAQSDMASAFLTAAGVYTYLKGIRSNSLGLLAISSLAIGASLGTKVTALLSGVSFVLAVLWVYSKYGPHVVRRTALWCLMSLFSVGAFAAPLYVQNWKTYGHPLGPHGSSSSAYRPRVTAVGTLSNSLRMIYESIDTTGFPRRVEWGIQSWLRSGGIFVFDVLNVDPNGPKDMIVQQSSFGFYEAPTNATHWGPQQNRRIEEMAWMGPVGIVVFVYVFVNALWFLRGRRWRLQSFYGWAALAHFVTVSAMLPWSPWRGRFMTYAFLMGTPLVSSCYEKRGFLVRPRFIICAVATMVVWNVSVTSPNRPIVGSDPVFRWSPQRQRSARRKSLESLMMSLETHVPAGAHMGAIAFDCEYVLFGERMDRIVQPVELLRMSDGVWDVSGKFPYVIVGKTSIAVDKPLEDDGYDEVLAGVWGKLYVRSDYSEAYKQNVTQQLFRKALSEGQPSQVVFGAELDRVLRPRQAPTLGPWGFEHRNWFWMGEGVAQGVEMHIYAKEAFDAVFTVDAAPGPSRRGRERTVEFAVSGDDGVVVQTANVRARTTLAFEVTIPEGNVTLTFACLDEADIPVLPNGDARPLLLQCFGIALQAAD